MPGRKAKTLKNTGRPPNSTAGTVASLRLKNMATAGMRGRLSAPGPTEGL